jgi:hypothetical protein
MHSFAVRQVVNESIQEQVRLYWEVEEMQNCRKKEYCLSLKIFLCGSLRVLCVSAVKVISTAENAEATQRTAARNYRIKTPAKKAQKAHTE